MRCNTSQKFQINRLADKMRENDRLHHLWEKTEFFEIINGKENM
jgi:hypothetical protein